MSDEKKNAEVVLNGASGWVTLEAARRCARYALALEAENTHLRARIAELEAALRELLSDSAAWQLGLDSRQRAAALLEKPQ